MPHVLGARFDGLELPKKLGSLGTRLAETMY